MTQPRIRLLALVVAVALLGTACGGSAESTGVATLENDTPGETLAAVGDPAVADETPATAEQTPEEALLAFTQCLRDRGLDVGDPTVDADGNIQLPRPDARGSDAGEGAPRGEVFREARAACAEHLEGVALGFGDDFDATELQDDLLAFAQCMRDNGVDMPDPDFSSFGPGQGGPFGRIDPSDPAFQEAQTACDDLLAGFGGGRFGGGVRGGDNG